MKAPSITEYMSPSEVVGLCKLAAKKPKKHPKAKPFVAKDDDEEPELVETAAAPVEPPKPDWKQRAKVVGVGALGMGAGTVAGYGAGMLADHLWKQRYGGSGVPLSTVGRILPGALLGGASSLAYSLWKAREAEELNRAVQPHPDHRSPG
jgi:hypothetical protein